MRLLYVIDSLAPGGAETSLAAMAPGLVKAGIELHVLPLGNRLDLAPQLQKAGAAIHPGALKKGRFGNLQAVLRVSRTVRPNLVHTTLFEADVAGRTAASLLRLPSSTSIVNDSYGPSHYAESNATKLHAARALDAATARFATRFHAISEAIADSVTPRIGIPRNRVDVIPRGRDPEKFPFQPKDLRSKTRQLLGIGENQPILLTIGRLEPQKGQHQLLNALPAVHAKYPDAVLLIAGKEGRSTHLVARLASSQGGDVRILGHRRDIPALLAAADVFCFPSEREGFGGALLEAMAVGCAIVATSIPTTREVLGNDQDGVALLVPVGDVEALGRAIVQTLSNTPATESRIRAGYSRFNDHYSLDAVVDQMTIFFGRAALDTK